MSYASQNVQVMSWLCFLRNNTLKRHCINVCIWSFPGNWTLDFCIWFSEIRGCIMLEELDELKQKKYKPAKVHLTCAWFLYLTLQIKLYPSWLEMIGWKEQTCISVSPSYLRIRHLEPREVSIQLQWEYQRLSQKIWCLTIKRRSFWSVTVQIWHLAFK